VSRPDLQYFETGGTWVKPPGAIRVDIVLQAAGGGSASVIADGLQGGVYVGGGRNGQIKVQSIAASLLPDLVSVTVGKGGRPAGQDGYVLVITHVRAGSRPAATPAGIELVVDWDQESGTATLVGADGQQVTIVGVGTGDPEAT